MGRKPRITLAEEPPPARDVTRLYLPDLPEDKRVELLCALANRLGLDPTGVGSFAKVVAGENDRVALVLGYRGIVRLALQSNQVNFLTAYVIHAKDTFALDLGTQYVKHAPYDGEDDPGAVTGAYCILLDGGGKRIEYASGREIAAAAGNPFFHWMGVVDVARRVATLKMVQSSPQDFGLLRLALDIEQRTINGQEIPELDTFLRRQ